MTCSNSLRSLRVQLKAVVRCLKSYNVGTRNYASVEHLVLQEGVAFEPALLPPDAGLPNTPRACFQNAFESARRPGSPWVYVEGFAIASDLPIAVHHAWLTRAGEHRAYDPTWQNLGCAGPGAVYLGLPLDMRHVMQVRRTAPGRCFGALDIYWERQPVLKGTTPLASILHPEFAGGVR